MSFRDSDRLFELTEGFPKLANNIKMVYMSIRHYNPNSHECDGRICLESSNPKETGGLKNWFACLCKESEYIVGGKCYGLEIGPEAPHPETGDYDFVANRDNDRKIKSFLAKNIVGFYGNVPMVSELE